MVEIKYNNPGTVLFPDYLEGSPMKVMLLREDRMIRYQGDVSKEKQERANNSYDGNDPFFKKNYDFKFKQ